jgi:superfamily I DNA/RNA helicase
MVQFRTLFPKAAVISLTKNYRSTQNILDYSYNLIQKNNPYRLEVEANIVKKLVSERKIEGHDPEFIYEKTGEDEAEAVVKKIKEEVTKNKRAYRDFAILVRANDHGLPFQKALERNKIPYQFLGPGPSRSGK